MPQLLGSSGAPLSNDNPQPDGAADPGVASTASRSDHVHADASSAVTLTGNVTGTGSGTIATTIANDAVTYAKMQNVSATDKLLGRASSGAGDVEEITCTAAGRSILDDADAAAQRVTLAVQDSARYLPIGGYYKVDATMGTLVIGGSPEAYNASAHAITGRTQTWTFLVSASVTSGQTATIDLYDLTASAVAATVSVTATTAGTPHTASITLPDTARSYELRASVTGTTTSHYVAILSAAIKQNWS